MNHETCQFQTKDCGKLLLLMYQDGLIVGSSSDFTKEMRYGYSRGDKLLNAKSIDTSMDKNFKLPPNKRSSFQTHKDLVDWLEN